MEFRILGPLQVWSGGEPVALGGTRQRSLLAILVLYANEPVARDRLIDELWGEQPPRAAVKTVQVFVSRLRKVLGPGAIATRPNGYALIVDPELIDLNRFERLAAAGRRALDRGDAEAARRALGEALGLWRGAPLADLAYENFARSEVSRLEELRLAALEDRIEADLRRGAAAGVVGELRGLAARHPLRERLREQLMLALYRTGRQADALDVYRETRAALVEELGIEPGRRLQELEGAILRHDAALDAPRQTSPPPASRSFVGRERELTELAAGLDEAVAGNGRLFLLGGEPGIGKSRLAEEIADRAREREMRVLWGRCWEAGGAPAHWPWVQSLRAVLRGREPAQLQPLVGQGAGQLAELLPELRELLPDVPAAARDPDAARFRLWDAVSEFVASTAREQPLLLVLDDLHAADESSLLLLRYLAGTLTDVPAVLLGAYRDTETGPGHPLEPVLADLMREPLARRIALTGLDRDDVADFVAASAGRAPPEGVVAEIHARTEGNPLFVGEMVRLLEAEGRLDQIEAAALGVPEGVTEVISRRLQRLAQPARRVLSLASVLGREFDVDTLEALADPADGDVLAVVDEAVAARLVGSSPGAPGRLRFSHTLVRDALYEAIPPGRRIELHRRIGEALERRYAADTDPHLAELAHHFSAATSRPAAVKAVRYAELAAERAAGQLAYEEEARLYRLALAGFERTGARDDERLCELLLRLGDALARAGNEPGAKAAFLEAAGIARSSSLPTHLARAGLGYGGRYVWMAARGDPHLVSLLEESLQGLDDEDLELRARLLARLAGAIRDEHTPERRIALSQEAVAIARRLGDPRTLGYALDARACMASPDMTEQNLADATELVEVANRAGDAERAFFGHLYRTIFFLVLGDPRAMRTELDVTTRLADELRQPGYRWGVGVVRPMLALFEGRFDAAEALIEETLVLGERAQSWNAIVSHRLQLFMLRWEQGRLAELEDAIPAWAEEYRASYPVWRCVLSASYAELGREAATRATFEELATSDFADLPFNDEWLLGMALLTHACAFVGDARRASVLYERLLPFAHMNVVSYIDVTLGSVERSLGLLAATMRRFDEAARHFDAAVDMNARMGGRPWVAHTRHDHAAMLGERGGPGDREEALRVGTLALDTYRELGMEIWAERASRLVNELARDELIST
jgi:DNA-binding SARP family transcriptional activator/tetratricopeptide (TPR) repeat protein